MAHIIRDNKISQNDCPFFRSKMSNPWLVDNIDHFWFLNCPECAFKTKTQNDFQKHAVVNHTLSSVLFSGHSDTHKVATIKEEIVHEMGNFNKLKKIEIKVEPDCLLTEDPTLEEIMYPDFEENVPDVRSLIATKNTKKPESASRKFKREGKNQLRNLIVKQCTEDFISPARLAVIHKLNVCTIRQWVKHSGKKLPIKYDLKQIPYKELVSTESFTEEDSFTSNDMDNESQAENYENNLLCPKCDHKSTSKYHLDMHIEAHRDCSVCGMTFFGPNSKRDLASHLKKHENKPKKQFICDFCNVEYATKQSLQRHQTTCKKKEFKKNVKQEEINESYKEEYSNEEYKDYDEEDVEGETDQEFAQETEEGMFGEGENQDEVIDWEVQ